MPVDPYSLCPCGSGKKVKFCCGDMVEDMERIKSLRENNQLHMAEEALRALKKKLQREGVFREMKLRRAYEKPSEKRAREKAEAIRRARKLARKRREREG